MRPDPTSEKTRKTSKSSRRRSPKGPLRDWTVVGRKVARRQTKKGTILYLTNKRRYITVRARSSSHALQEANKLGHLIAFPKVLHRVPLRKMGPCGRAKAPPDNRTTAQKKRTNYLREHGGGSYKRILSRL